MCFSFQAIKHLTTGDGGALFCKKKADDKRAKLLRWFGINRHFKGSKWTQDIKECGYKFHMNNLTAAIGLEQMKHISKLTFLHKTNGRYYDNHIDSPKIEKLSRGRDSTSSYWIYSLLCKNRDKLRKHLAKFKCKLPGLDYFNPRLLNIPVGWWLSKKNLDHVVKTINEFDI